MKGSLGGQLEVSYLSLRGFSAEAACVFADIFLSVWGKGKRRFLSLGKSAVRSFASVNEKKQKYGG